MDATRNIAQIDPAAAAKIASTTEDYQGLINDAAQASADERQMTVMDAIRSHPKAVFYSIGISLAIVMEGYDMILLGNFYAQPAFAKRYGVCSLRNGVEDCQIPAAWQSGLSNGSQIGSLVGLQLVGVLSDRIGYRKTMMASLFFMSIFTFIPFFAQNLVTLLMGQLLQGIPWGVFQSMAVAYAADVCPVTLRPIMTTYVNLCWVMGQLIAAGVLRATLDRTDQWAYRIPYGLQWLWIPFILLVTIFAPESPWFLVRANRMEEAEVSLRRLAGKGYRVEDIQKTLALLKHTDEMEKVVTAGTSYRDCFRGSNLRRTEIACMAWLTQQFCGTPFMGFSSYFLIQAGVSTKNAFDLTIGQFSIGVVGTIGSWFLMSWLGRRTIYLTGEALMVIVLAAIGIIGSIGESPWAVGALLLVFTLIYNITVGPACYSIVAEIPSTRLRAKTVVIARGCYNLAGIVINVIQPRLINPDEWNLGARAGYVWMATGALFFVWMYFRLPEPKGRTYGELDVLFEGGISARLFRTTRVEEFVNPIRIPEKANSVDAGSNSETDSYKGKTPSNENVQFSTLSYTS